MTARFPMAAAAVTVATSLGISPLQANEHDTCGVDILTMARSGTITGNMKTIGWLVGVRWGHGVLALDNAVQIEGCGC